VKKINPEYLRRIYPMVNSCPYFELLSMRLLEAGIGRCRLEIELDRKHLQPFGMVHGGVFASIIDAAAFWSVYCDIDDAATGLTTVDLTLNYLAPASSGRLVATGRRIKLGRTLGYAEAEVRDGGGGLLAHGTSTLILMPGKGITGDPPLPPKFIE
jgi:uncharacterized protein (TIGR00369 family)